MQFHIANLVGPVDIADLTEAAVMEDVNLSHISFCYSQALRAIQKDSVNVTVVKPGMTAMSVFVSLTARLTESTK